MTPAGRPGRGPAVTVAASGRDGRPGGVPGRPSRWSAVARRAHRRATGL